MSLPTNFFIGRGGGGGGAGSGYFGLGYSGFNNNNPILADVANPGSGTNAVPGTDVWNSLDTHLDYDAGTVWASYSTISEYTMANTGTYTNDAYYLLNASNKNDLSGAALSGVASAGRGQTVAYLSDAPRTPVLVAGMTGASNGATATTGLQFFNYSTGAWLGRMTFDPGTTPTPGDLSGLAWDGTNLLVVSRTPYGSAPSTYSKLFRIPLPSSITNNGVLTVLSETLLPHLINYGMAWYGGGVYMTEQVNGISQISLDFTNNTSALVGAAAKYKLTTPASMYSATLDYKNRRLVLGGYTLSEVRSFGE